MGRAVHTPAHPLRAGEGRLVGAHEGIHLVEVSGQVVEPQNVVATRELGVGEAEALPGVRGLIGARVVPARVHAPGLVLRDEVVEVHTARVSARLINKDASEYVDFVSDVQAKAEELFGGEATVTVTGNLKLFTQMIGLLMTSLAESYTIAAVVITILMMLMLGSFRIGLLSMLPNLAPIVVTMGMMGWLGIKLDMSNMLLGTVAIGLAVDDTIHFFHNFRRHFVETGSAAEAVRETMLSTGRAMLFTSLVLVTGFWVLMFATLNNIILFGFLTGITLILALLADFLLAPAMMELIIRTGRGRRIAMRWGAGGGETA